MEIGSYFRDAGNSKKAGDFINLARRLLVGNEIYSKTLIARLWQHEGINRIIENDLAKASDCFKHMESEITSEYPVGHANQALYEIQILLRQQNPPLDQVRHILRKTLEQRESLHLTRWTHLELRLAEAQTLFERNNPKAMSQAFDHASYALELSRKERIIPTRATFPSVLRHFADVYADRKFEIIRLSRSLPANFVYVADLVYDNLKALPSTRSGAR
jgi:hypothetical protein